VIIKLFKAEGITGFFVRQGIASATLRVSNVVLGLILSIMMARLLGASGYGVYSYVLAIITVISIPAQFGIPKLVIRETAKAQVNQDWALLRGLWKWSSLAVFLLSILLIGLCVLIALSLTDTVSAQELNIFYLGLLLIPLISLGSLRAATLQGLRHIVLGQLPESIIRPTVLIILVIALSTTVEQDALLTPFNAMGAHVVAVFIGFLAGAWFLLNKIPPEIHGVERYRFQHHDWFHAILPLALTAGMNQVNNYADIIMLGLYYPAEDVGFYRIAIQGGLLVSFGLQISAMFVSPYIARLHARGELRQLQQIVTISAIAAFIIALVAVLLFTFFGEPILGYFFGGDFVQAYEALLILAAGQLINAFFGPIAILLNMTGNEKSTAKGMAIAASANILLNFILIPPYGMEGAAIATVCTLFLWNAVMWFSARKFLNINCSVFGLRSVS